MFFFCSQRYEGNLQFAKRSGIFRGMLTGVSGGLTWFLIFASYALAFWYGVKLVMDDAESCLEDPANCHVRYEPKTMLVVGSEEGEPEKDAGYQ